MATILRCGGPKCVLARGTLTGQQGFTVSITLVHSAQALAPGQEVVVACGPAGRRVALLARFGELRDGHAVFVRLSPWRPTDTRAFPRFTTSLHAFIAAADVLVHATVVDISLGGMAIEAEGRVEADSILARIDDGDDSSPPLPCSVVRKRRDGESTRLHVEFGVLSSEATSFVERLVRVACMTAESWRLAS